ncbi:hypothetical protein pb186bvf_017692 [Paramecium bursaria]
MKQIITTPLFYLNSRPHIGHLYSMIYADAISKIQKAPLLTGNFPKQNKGTDEHGQKVFKSAKEANIQEYCDLMSHKFRMMADSFKIQYSHFIRTTDQSHVDKVQEIWTKLYNDGRIYKDKYSGYYNFVEEAFVDDPSQQFIEEENYFFKLDKDFTQNYILQFKQYLLELQQHKSDKLCISRPVHRQIWGIKVPNDHDQNIYVWFDALFGYYQQQQMHYKHVIGKDIIKFHAIYWPNFLKSLGHEPDLELIIHNHWIKDNKKMSKSLNNVINPMDLLKKYSEQQIRLYFLAEGPQNHDVDFQEEDLIKTWNNHINQFQNLLCRILTPKLIKPNLVVYDPQKLTDSQKQTLAKFQQYIEKLRKLKQQHKLVEGYIEIKQICSLLNDYLQTQAPWNESDKQVQEQIISVALIMLSMIQQEIEVYQDQIHLIYPKVQEIPNQIFEFKVDTSQYKKLVLSKIIT